MGVSFVYKIGPDGPELIRHNFANKFLYQKSWDSVCLFVCLSVCLCVCLFVCLMNVEVCAKVLKKDLKFVSLLSGTFKKMNEITTI